MLSVLSVTAGFLHSVKGVGRPSSGSEGSADTGGGLIHGLRNEKGSLQFEVRRLTDSARSLGFDREVELSI